MLSELLEKRRKEKQRLDNQARAALTAGIIARYVWIAVKWSLVVLAAGVFAIFYMFFKVIFTGNTGR
jgi:hypothetical protein